MRVTEIAAPNRRLAPEQVVRQIVADDLVVATRLWRLAITQGAVKRGARRVKIVPLLPTERVA